jgi:hypothetical protein
MQITIDEMALKITKLRKKLSFAVAEQSISKKERSSLLLTNSIMVSLYKKIAINAAHISELHSEIEKTRSQMKVFPRDKIKLLAMMSELLDSERGLFKKNVDIQVTTKRKLSDHSNFENKYSIGDAQRLVEKNKTFIQYKAVYVKKLKMKYGQVSDLVFELKSTT